MRIAVVGFGEAATAFFGQDAESRRAASEIQVYDRKTEAASTARAKWAEYDDHGVTGCGALGRALAGVEAVVSLVTADQALAVAQAAAGLAPAGALWLDMNSVAPDSKRGAAQAIEGRGGRCVDVAVMSPVHPRRTGVPLLVCGAHAEHGARLLHQLGFSDVGLVEGGVGAASAIKMIRSVMVKGIEALSAECFLAAQAAGVLGKVTASLDASPAPPHWRERAAYNLERMTTHGLRRAAEMEEAVATLDALGVGADMSRATVVRQRRLGELGVPLGAREALEPRLDTLLAALGLTTASAAA